MEKGLKNLTALSRSTNRRAASCDPDDVDSGMGPDESSLEDLAVAEKCTRRLGEEEEVVVGNEEEGGEEEEAAAMNRTVHLATMEMENCQQCQEERRRGRSHCSDVEQGAQMLLDLPKPPVTDSTARLPSLREMMMPEIR